MTLAIAVAAAVLAAAGCGAWALRRGLRKRAETLAAQARAAVDTLNQKIGG